MSQQQLNEEPRPSTEPPPNPGVLGIGILAAAITFAGFCAYAFFSPPTYRTSATVVIESSADGTQLGPLEAARRLHEAVLDREVLARFAAEQAPSETPEVHLRIARAIQAAFQIDSVDGHTFTVSCSDSDSSRVERRCNELAARAVERGPRLLAPERSERERTLEDERRRRVNDFLAFLSAHPEPAAAPHGEAAPSDGTETELRAEKARIEARIAERARPGSSDNPYAEPAGEDAEGAQLVRRLVAINAALAARDAPPAKSAPLASPDIAAERQRLLAEVGKARVAAEAAKGAPVTFKARLVSRAIAPAWPVEPNRQLLLFGGAAASLLAFAAATLGAKALGQRGTPRGLSSFPPTGFGSSFPPGQSSSAPAPDISSAPPLPPLGSDTSAAFSDRLAPIAALAPAPIISLPSPFPPAAAPTRSSTPAPLPLPDVVRISSSVPPARVIPITNDPQSFSLGPAEPRQPATDGAVGARSERALRAAVEVNAEMPALSPARQPPSNPPAQSIASTTARTTQVLGSPIPPIIAPGSRRTPSAGAGLSAPRATPVPVTGYSYVSTPPPFASEPAAGKSSAPAPASPRATTISTRPAPPGWRPDLSLLPESRRALCDEIYPQAVDRCLVIAVLGGSGSAEGKSRLSAELALALAESGHPRVLVLEGNLQRPAVRRFLRVEMPSGCGMSQQLKARIAAGAQRPWTVVECSATLHVLAEGNDGSPELMLSRPFEDIVTELRSFYDFIVVDGPMIDDPASCRAVNDVVDGAVLSSGTPDDADLRRARALFPDKRISTVSSRR